MILSSFATLGSTNVYIVSQKSVFCFMELVYVSDTKAWILSISAHILIWSSTTIHLNLWHKNFTQLISFHM